jgi:hypothetical protein
VKYPQLSGQQLERLRALENELGKVVVAVQPQSSIAELSPKDLNRLQQAEQELGMILLAYNVTDGR